MSRIAPKTFADLPEAQRTLRQQMSEGRNVEPEGELGGPFDAWALNPSIGRRAWQLGGTIRFKPTIDRRYIELAILMTGQLWQAQFEWFAHEPMAREAGLPEAVIQAIKVGEEPEFVDEGDKVCWRFCRELLGRRKIEDDLYQATVARFDEAGVADLINTCGFYTLVSMTLNTFEVQLPDGVEPPFPG